MGDKRLDALPDADTAMLRVAVAVLERVPVDDTELGSDGDRVGVVLRVVECVCVAIVE